MTIELWVELNVKDKNGKVKYSSGKQPSHSFVKQFLHVLAAMMQQSTTYSVKDTSNTSRTLPYASAYSTYTVFALQSSPQSQAYGLVVGSGTGAEDNTNYALGTLITTLSYQGHSITAPAVVGSNVDMVLARPFYNGTAGTITINEVGIYIKTLDSTPIERYFCIARDKLGSGVDVDPADTATLQYTLRTNVGV